MQILVIEDDAFLRKAYEVSLRSQGFDVILATDGALGLRMAEAIHPDAILLDVLLPMLTGVEVLQRLKHHPALSNIPVIVFSASCDPEDARVVLALGAKAYVCKSEIDLQELGKTLRSFVSADSEKEPIMPLQPPCRTARLSNAL
jgi:DNA-binding response OmpR family regulator